jgi:hypothetical protein
MLEYYMLMDQQEEPQVCKGGGGGAPKLPFVLETRMSIVKKPKNVKV